MIFDKQLKYILNQLKNTKEKNLIILSHHCINKCGSWKSENHNYDDGILTLKKALIDFVHKEKGSYKGNTWDFTKNTTTLHLYLSGDSHFNNKSNEDGYIICCRQGSGGCTPNDLPEGAIYDVFDKTKQCNFDILVINKHNKVKLFRVGEGEGKLDI